MIILSGKTFQDYKPALKYEIIQEYGPVFWHYGHQFLPSKWFKNLWFIGNPQKIIYKPIKNFTSGKFCRASLWNLEYHGKKSYNLPFPAFLKLKIAEWNSEMPSKLQIAVQTSRWSNCKKSQTRNSYIANLSLLTVHIPSIRWSSIKKSCFSILQLFSACQKVGFYI